MLTKKRLKHYMSRGGVWIIMANNYEMQSILLQLKDQNTNLHAMQVDTIEDAVKANLLIEAFNTWNIEGIREFMKSHKNFPKIDEKDY